jgi:hypothetical protein
MLPVRRVLAAKDTRGSTKEGCDTMNRYTFTFLVLAVSLLAGPVQAQQERFQVYGFFDLELDGTNKNPDDFQYTFDQHHFNVITVYRMSDRWRVFGEVEWEHGVSLNASGGSGLVALERAWVEYAHTDALRVKAGKFLPPFGNYNQLHDATPTFLSSFLPNAVYGKHSNTVGGSQRLYAKFGTGIQVLGTFFPGSWQADYYAYVTNGRGPRPGEADNDRNKGVGGRFVLTAPNDVARLGASYYEDRNGAADGTKQRAIAAELAFGTSGFWLEGEALIPVLETVDGAGVPNGAFRTGLGYYVQASYRTSVGLTPFGRFGVFDPDVDVADDGDNDIVLGLNFALRNFAYLKGEIQFLNFQDPTVDGYERFVSSIAIAF